MIGLVGRPQFVAFTCPEPAAERDRHLKASRTKALRASPGSRYELSFSTALPAGETASQEPPKSVSPSPFVSPGFVSPSYQ
jgi:hypothetical protein